jgi:hypothetical protein
LIREADARKTKGRKSRSHRKCLSGNTQTYFGAFLYRYSVTKLKITFWHPGGNQRIEIAFCRKYRGKPVGQYKNCTYHDTMAKCTPTSTPDLSAGKNGTDQRK